jgi:hypothetical protein
MHVDYEQVVGKLPDGKTGVAEVTLVRGDTAWMPGTTKHLFHGPVTVRYMVHVDGGVDAQVIA